MISLNYRDSRPIYEQIRDGLRRLIAVGAIERDERLPSVRVMATELAINPNTIQRAYAELEAEGYIYTISGKGSFASDLWNQNEGRRKELLQQAEELFAELRCLAVTPEELLALYEKEGET